jgi:hypothetical protein
MTKFITFPFSLSKSPCIIIYFCMFFPSISLFLSSSLYILYVYLFLCMLVCPFRTTFLSMHVLSVFLFCLSFSVCKSNSMFVCLFICFNASIPIYLCLSSCLTLTLSHYFCLSMLIYPSVFLSLLFYVSLLFCVF